MAVSRERDGLEGSFPSRSPDAPALASENRRGRSLKRGELTPERVALAESVRRMRDVEGLLFRQITAELGISYSYAQQLYDDPDGSKARARKDSYRGICEDCGGPTTGSEGAGEARPKRCAPCQIAYQHDAREWTPEAIIERFREFERVNGRPPAALDYMHRAPSAAVRNSPERIAEAAEMVARCPLPPPGVVQREFAGGWREALEAAGFGHAPTGGAGHRGHRRPRGSGVTQPLTPPPPLDVVDVFDEIEWALEELFS